MSLAVQPLLVIVSGPSGSGKGTLINHIVREIPEFQRVTTYTTRKPRLGEQDGIDYNFLDEKTFHNYVESGEITESTRTYGDRWYGSPRKMVTADIETPLITELEVKGFLRMRTLSARKVVGIFIYPPDIKELTRRLMERHREDNLSARLSVAQEQIQYALAFDYIVQNAGQEQFLEEGLNVVKAELTRAKGVSLALNPRELNR